MPKLEVKMFERTASTPPDFKKTNQKDIARSIPVSEHKREACKAIQTNVMGRIEERIALEKAKVEADNLRAEKAAEPFNTLRAKLSNPRIKRASKTKR